MAFLGKEYKFVRDENFEGFVNSWGVSAEQAERYYNYKPTQKLTLSGDTYTFVLSSPENTKELTFKSAVEFDEHAGLVDSKTTITVDGNVMTQVQKYPDGKVFTFKREFNGDDLLLTITNSSWDGVARRYYKA